MKKRFGRLVCLCLLAVLLLVTAAAQEPETAEKLQTVQTSFTVDLFQRGSLTGNYTKPGDVSLFADEEVEEALYAQILEGVMAQQSTIKLTIAINGEEVTSLMNMVAQIYEKAVNDNPRLFYVSNAVRLNAEYTSATLWLTLTPSYWATVTDAQISDFNEAVETAKAQVAGVTDPVEIALILHDYLVLQNAYDWDVATGGTTDDSLVYTAYAALVQGNPVCQGYALAYNLLLNELGVECVMVSSNGMKHAWNMVELGEEWYHVDVTWDDPVPNMEGYCGHDYFLLSDETISGEHYGWDSSLPYCVSDHYESGWIFNESRSSVYRWKEFFYYVDNDFMLCEAYGLDDIQEKVCTLSQSYQSGFAWADGCLYFVPYTSETKHTLKVCMLDSCEIEDYYTFDFTATGVPAYAADYDFIGLRVNPAETELEIVSTTRREKLYAVPLPEKETGITYVTAEPSDNCVRIKFRLYAVQSGSLICAVYDANGKQLGVHCLNQLISGEYTLELPCNANDAASVKIFLLDENSSPLRQETVISVNT